MQIISVYASGNRAMVALNQKEGHRYWKPIVKTQGFIGKNGLGKMREGDNKTPAGTFEIGRIFGIKENPRN